MLIGELARRSGLSKDGIRHYEKVGILRSTRRRAGSRWYRDYDEEALTLIERVRQAQRLGLSLKEIGPLLEIYASRTVTHEEAISFLEDRLRTIRNKIAALHEVEAFVEKKLARHRESAIDQG